MNVLIYVGHPAQYHFFKNTIVILKEHGHKVILLMKTKDVLEELIKQDGHEYINIQPKSRKNNLLSILTASFSRTWKVIKLAKRHHVDILLGTDASVAQAGFVLNRPSITTLEDDYDVITRLAKLTYPYTSTILVPTVCSVGKWKDKKVAYEGYMKLAYLHPKRFSPNIEIKRKYILEEKYCIIRLAGLTAYHDTGIKGLNIGLVRSIITDITDKGFKAYISAEDKLDAQFSAYQLKINHNDIHHVLSFASLLISDSQSMSVEAAMLGVPSIRFSDFAGRISVLEELEQKYHLTYGVSTNKPEKLLKLINEILSDPSSQEVFSSNRTKMLEDKIDVTAFLVWFIEHYPDSIKTVKEPLDTNLNFNQQVLQRDFTITSYQYLLLSLQSAGYSFITFADWCEGKAAALDKYIILRHDIDKNPHSALKIAKIEAGMGVRSTFYWLTRKAVFHPVIIKEIAVMGHEIGYHYRDLVDANGNLDESLILFQRNLLKMRALVDIKTIAMDGCPWSKYNNRDLWKSNDYESFGIIGEPYFDIFGAGDKPAVSDVYYLTDTGRMWNGNRFSIRDKVQVNPIQSYHSTPDIIHAANSSTLPNKIMITTHPQRWTDNFLEWLLEWGMQGLKNRVKGLLVKIR